MINYTKDILNLLLDRYSNSKISKEGTKVTRRIFINKHDDIFHKAFISSDAYKFKDDIVNDLNTLVKDGVIYFTYDKKNNISEIGLNIDLVNNLFAFMNRENPRIICDKILNYLKEQKYDGVIQNFIDNEVIYIESNYHYHKKYYSDLNELKIILNILDELLKLEIPTKERDFSVKVLNDSKLFTNYKNKIITILKENDTSLVLDDYENDDEVFEHYNIIKNSTYVLIKNNLVFKLNDQIIDLNKLNFEFALSDEMITQIELLESNFNKVITVENLTSFYKLNEKDAVIIFLSGFHNHTKRMLLNKIYEKYPDKKYYHFGDIDVGGFRIFAHLKRETKIPFGPYKMSINELQNDSVNFKPLTNHDIGQLKLMRSNTAYDIFKDEIDYMLKQNIKLEQENLD